ncbi:hypothetical protein IGI04_023389 [Brassica rapa subsp. trilocularis]|uniref:Uncharacterized protein n=1 Tax=Brassica rapa subsp. trilocularis TaxID=1813537 RepID=A0ABQ7M7W9_BRACM|nr:hypothetical protein IGI04_023389 [Brassica rapa subsp. trilocularis]
MYMLNLVYLLFMADPREIVFFLITCLPDLGCLSRFKLFSASDSQPMRLRLRAELFLASFAVREESIHSEEGGGAYISKYIKGILKSRLSRREQSGWNIIDDTTYMAFFEEFSSLNSVFHTFLFYGRLPSPFSRERARNDLLKDHKVLKWQAFLGGSIGGCGHDVVIRSATEPEVNPKPYSTSQGANKDIHALQMPYLTNQEGLNHEANFYGFYTQEGVQTNCNWAKIFTEKEVMNFTTRKFLSPSICEYPTLEGDLSSSKERPEAKPIIEVKRSLSAFHKAQDQEKWPRNYEVMIQSPKPVKPVLDLPQLEANRFNQLQTRHWRPGDHFNQSGDILGVQEEFCKFIPCTSNHWIRRILIYSNLPYLEQTDINVQQLFSLQIRHEIRTYKAPKKVPRKLSYPLKPSRSATEPEVNPKPYSTSQGANKDIHALQMPYLTNQEGLNHEANFYGFYTQKGVQTNCNWAKIFTEKEVMNFTTRKFLSPSICEYPTLEGDLSSSKERPEAKPIIEVKRSLSAFHKAQDQEKWPRNYEVMIQSPKPAKPVLDLPQLEANRFNQLQTRHWRPGDHFNQSGDILGV